MRKARAGIPLSSLLLEVHVQYGHPRIAEGRGGGLKGWCEMATLQEQLVDAAKAGEHSQLIQGTIAIDILAALLHLKEIEDDVSKHEAAVGLVKQARGGSQVFGLTAASKLLPKGAVDSEAAALSAATATAVLAFVNLDLTARACRADARSAAGMVGMAAQAILKDLMK